MNGNNNELHEKLFGKQPEKKRFPLFFVISAALLLVAVILLSTFLESCDSAITGKSSSFASIFKFRDISAISF